MFTAPSVSDYQNYFFRDFPYNSSDPNTGVLNQDIIKAFGCTDININQGLFANQAAYTQGYLLLSAHYLVTNLRNSSQGINGQYNWLENSKGVGSVSTSFSIPPRITENPYFSMLTKTNYGQLYLQLLMPQLVGQMWGSYAPTKP